MDELLFMYYDDNAKKLHAMVDKILTGFGGVSHKDYDDFYSLANEVFTYILHHYSRDKGNFEGYLYSCLSNKIKTEFTARNRHKRRAERLSIPIDTPIDDEENVTLADILADDLDIEKEVIGEESVETFKLEEYLNKLSKRQRKILELLSASYHVNEIMEMLHLTAREYSDALAGIHAYENVSVLF